VTKPLRQLRRLVLLALLSLLALQLFFVLRIALMGVVDPQSTSFQRSEIWRLASQTHTVLWSETWVPDEQLSKYLKRAVIASEDAGFVEHSGVEWDAIEQAWERNQRAQARATQQNEKLEERAARQKNGAAKPVAKVSAKVVGGSTITQQLAKNLFLSGERTAVRKAQEIVITYLLEGLLGKRRILTLYLNHVEWGEGVFGAQAAARHYFRTDASQLGPYPAARLAVMLPAPKRYEKSPYSAYVAGRAGVIVARMNEVELP
jgi:monofunctional biosynthetic peptidoglycan transglycosylase